MQLFANGLFSCHNAKNNVLLCYIIFIMKSYTKRVFCIFYQELILLASRLTWL